MRGARVLSLAQGLIGNVTAQMMGELGAEVVKVESLKRPDGNRRLLAPDHPRIFEPSGTEVSVLFGGIARSQLGLGLDFTQPEGRGIFDRLLGVTDVLLYNLSPFAAERLNLGWPIVSAVKPDLILLALSGYGATGPSRQHLAYGGNIAAFVSLTRTWGFSHGAHHDYLAAYHGVFAAAVALFHRERTGEGAFIDLAQTEAGCAVMGPVLMGARDGDDVETVESNMVPWAAFAAVLRCKGDDDWVAVEASDEAGWSNLCEAMDQEGLASEPKYATAELRRKHYYELRELFEIWSRARTAYQACRQLQRSGVCAGAVQDAEDLYRDPQVWFRSFVQDVSHPDLGIVSYPGPAIHLSKTPMTIRGHAPRLGQDTRTVLQRWLDMSDDELRELVGSEAIYDERGGLQDGHHL